MNLEELLSECTFERVTPTLLEQCEPFACGHDDLDEFFRSDYKLYADKKNIPNRRFGIFF